MAEVTIESSTPQGSAEPILGKFKSQDDLVAAYTALEKKLSEKGMTMEVEGEVPAPMSPESVTETSETVYGEGITSALTVAGLDVDTVSAEYESESGLTDDTKRKLYSTFGQAVVDNYFAGLDAQRGAATAKVSEAEQGILDMFGGQEGWGKVSQWAAQGSPDLSDAFNQALDSGNPAFMKTASMALKSAYESSQGTLSPQTVLTNQVPVSSAGVGYTSKREMMADINSDAYKHDPSFREGVANRIASSQGFSYN